jgi:hypothetical protein
MRLGTPRACRMHAGVFCRVEEADRAKAGRRCHAPRRVARGPPPYGSRWGIEPVLLNSLPRPGLEHRPDTEFDRGRPCRRRNVAGPRNNRKRTPTPMTWITAKVLSDDGTRAEAPAEPASRQPGYEPHPGLEVPGHMCGLVGFLATLVDSKTTLSLGSPAGGGPAGSATREPWPF